jgi:hypothetical protein
MDSLSKWYSDYCKTEYIDYSDNKFKINLAEVLTGRQVVDFMQDIQKHLSEKTYRGLGAKDINQDPDLTYTYYFNTLTVSNNEILESLKRVLGEV